MVLLDLACGDLMAMLLKIILKRMDLRVIIFGLYIQVNKENYGLGESAHLKVQQQNDD